MLSWLVPLVLAAGLVSIWILLTLSKPRLSRMVRRQVRQLEEYLERRQEEGFFDTRETSHDTDEPEDFLKACYEILKTRQ
jgi:hypothetical protein